MRVPQYASRSLVAVALATLLAGCGNDSTAPNAPFSPTGTSADIAALGQSFDSEALASYGGVALEIGNVVGGSAGAAIRAYPSMSLLAGDKAGAVRYARALSRAYAGGGLRPSFSVAAARIPQEYLGVTFVWDVATHHYVASDQPGAPANGVRFVLYAVNPVTGLPIEDPLTPIDGYVDVQVSETPSSATARVLVVASGATYLDYNVLLSGTSTSVDIDVTGFVSNGTNRVNFDLGHRFTSTTQSLDYELVVPTRGGFLLDFEASFSGLDTGELSLTVDLLARGDNGTIRIEGTETDAGGSYQVQVNGDPFATITVDGSGQATIVGADGQPLSQEELQALELIFGIIGSGGDLFDDLMLPVGIL